MAAASSSSSRCANVRGASGRRKGKRRGGAPLKAAPALVWPPAGYFLEPVYAWFGPGWKPATDWGRDDVATSARSRAARERRVAMGDPGSIVGMSKRSDARLAAVPMSVAALLRKAGAR